MIEPELREVSWAFEHVGQRSPHSKRHWYVDPTGDSEPSRTLCGKLIPWGMVHDYHESDCGVCLRVMEARGIGVEIRRARALAAAVIGMIENNPNPPEGEACYRAETRPAAMTEEEFITQAKEGAGAETR